MVRPTSLVRLSIGAVCYLAAQIEQFWIAQVRLPSDYRLLGRDISGDDRYRRRLGRLFARLDRVSGRLAALAQYPREEEAAARGWTRFSSALRAWWIQLRLLPYATWLRRRRRALHRRIGHAAYAMDGQTCGTPPLTTPIGRCLERIEELRHLIDRLSLPGPGEVLTPQRLAWLLIIVVVLMLLLLAQRAYIRSADGHQAILLAVGVTRAWHVGGGVTGDQARKVLALLGTCRRDEHHRLPSTEETLDWLKVNGRYSGEWEDNEAGRAMVSSF